MISVEQLLDVWKEKFGDIQDYEAYFSPGRVNLIGEHIDYNGGYVMPFAIDLGITAIFVPHAAPELEIYSVDFDEKIFIRLDLLVEVEGKKRWPLYVVGSLRKITERNIPLRGGKMIFQSDLPLGSGLSSSAAIECLIIYMMSPSYYHNDRKALALDAQRAEIDEVGVKCGIMDQYAVAFGRKGHALLLDCQNIIHEYVPLDFKDYQLVVINSNYPRTLADSKYNERWSECQDALKIVQRFDPAEQLAQVHEISIGYIEDDNLYFRAKHVVTEQQRVLAAFDALKLGRIDYLGGLLWASHASLDEDYEVAGDALNCIVYYAHKFKDCIGARMTGAGFGGCAIALVEKSAVKRFITYVGKKYEEDQGRKADFYLVNSSDGVSRIR